MSEKNIDRDRVISLIQELINELKLGDDEGLTDTPRRITDMYLELFSGVDVDPGELLDVQFNENHEELVILKDIPFYSMCEHHLLPFIGKCHVAYLPKGKVIGLSKVARIVDMYARRLQIQENLTNQIAEAILSLTEGAGAAVIIEAQHMCMMMRGVQKQNSVMTTSCMLGAFRSRQSTRNEFLSLVSQK